MESQSSSKEVEAKDKRCESISTAGVPANRQSSYKFKKLTLSENLLIFASMYKRTKPSSAPGARELYEPNVEISVI